MSKDARERSGLGLHCFSCQEEHDPSQLNNVCRLCGLPLEISVPLPMSPLEEVIDRDLDSMWRYGAVLPVPADQAVSLGEGWTPLHDIGQGVWVKDESVNPTASFKDRGMSMATSAARALGAEGFAAPSAGNAGVALAAYGSKAGLPVTVAMPEDTPKTIIERCREYGAHVELVPGTIGDAGKWLAEHGNPQHFNVSTLKEPYRVEGKKT
ncbi:MAG: pyridoxal-phosphate dependent enzyme, partial [Acidimicrobiia bacterium]